MSPSWKSLVDVPPSPKLQDQPVIIPVLVAAKFTTRGTCPVVGVPVKSLAGAGDSQLVAALDSDNLFWRQTAQRLLVDGGKTDAAAGLRSKVVAGGAGAIQTL